jgi:cell division protein FtsW (lipid II flippase)
MFCIQTVLHHPKAVKILLPFILVAAIAVTAVLGYVNNHYEAVETYNAYLEEVEKSDSPGDLEEPPKPGEINSKLKRVYDWSLNIKLLFDVEEAVENAEAKEDNSTQQSSAMEAMMLGGLFGNEYVTAYESSDKIQEINNDMAFSYLTLKLGILNALILIALFIIMFVIATKECLKNPSLTTASIGISFAAMLSVQSLVSAMSAIGFLPVIGVQLPFIGSGGAYLLISFVVLFFIIYATSDLHKNDVATEPEETTENTKEETNNVCTD